MATSRDGGEPLKDDTPEAQGKGGEGHAMPQVAQEAAAVGQEEMARLATEKVAALELQVKQLQETLVGALEEAAAAHDLAREYHDATQRDAMGIRHPVLQGISLMFSELSMGEPSVDVLEEQLGEMNDAFEEACEVWDAGHQQREQQWYVARDSPEGRV